MTRDEYAVANRLAHELVQELAFLQPPPPRKMLAKAVRLAKMLKPPITMAEILAKIPGDTLTAQAKAIDMSRSGFYNLSKATARRDPKTARNLAAVTGVPEAVIKEVW